MTLAFFGEYSLIRDRTPELLSLLREDFEVDRVTPTLSMKKQGPERSNDVFRVS